MSALWDPTALSPAVWVDDNTPTYNSSGTLLWVNAGTIGQYFRQLTSSNHPAILENALAGRRVLRFDGVNDELDMNFQAAGDLFRNKGAGWSFLVFRKRTVDSSATRTLFFAPNSGGASRFNVYVGDASPNQNRHSFATRRLDGDSTAIVRGADVGTNWLMRRTCMSWASNVLTDHVNGSVNMSASPLSASGNTSDTAASTQWLALGGSNGNFSDVDVACVIAGSGAALPSEADFKRLEGWAAHRYGLAASLPIDHPYRSAPPVAGPMWGISGARLLDEHEGLYPVTVNTKLRALPDPLGVRARVSLLRKRDLKLARTGWTDDAGTATFPGLRSDQEHYIALAEYPGNPPDPTAAEYLRPVAGVSPLEPT